MAVPTLNLASLRSQARLKSGVSANDYSNANLDSQFNIGYSVLAYYLAHLDEDYFEEQHAKFNLGQNSGLYSLPTDCIAVKQLRLAYSTPSNPEDYKVATPYDITEVRDVQVDEEDISSTNPIYDITNNYFRIKPRPTSAVTNGGEIFYIAAPSALTLTSDTPVIPAAYHDLIAVYGAKEMAFKYEKWKKHDRLAKQWGDQIAEFSQLLADRDRNRPVRMKSPLEVGSPNRSTVREL